ncbi:MAG: hypothetical protein H7145_18810 [Akkermansiaceae bacterium]|nr:hypothetical protein [Armatimonadota bacterium]
MGTAFCLELERLIVMSYARARLWLGITGVGTIVVLCLVALVFRIPALLLHTGAQPVWRDGYELAAVLFLYATVQGAFDFFGGHILPTEYGRTTARFGAFLAGWLRGVLCHSAVLLLIGVALIRASQAGGFWATMGTFAAISLVLLLAQAGLAGLIGGIPYRRGDDLPGSLPVTVAQSTTPYFTGGIVGVPGFERLVLPARWQDAFSPEQMAAILSRKTGVVRTGSRLRGLALAIGFNAIGFALSYTLGGGTASVAALVSTSLWFTVWSFIGLLLLPTPSQSGVFRADAFALSSGTDADTLASVIQRLDEDQDDEATRPSGVEKIFHPLPSVERRLARLFTPETADPGAWHAARTAIYLSWAGMSFLSRAVHCNSGRPDAWVFLPSD